MRAFRRRAHVCSCRLTCNQTPSARALPQTIVGAHAPSSESLAPRLACAHKTKHTTYTLTPHRRQHAPNPTHSNSSSSRTVVRSWTRFRDTFGTFRDGSGHTSTFPDWALLKPCLPAWPPPPPAMGLGCACW
eukprot:653680-Rhodomonas_salina.2